MTPPVDGAVPLHTDVIRMPVPLTIGYALAPGMRIVFFSGLTAKDADSRTVGDGDAGAQADHIFDAIEDTLHSAGGTLQDVVKLTVYLQSRDHAAAVGRVRARRFSRPPASTMVIAQLMSDDQLVEIEAVAALPA